MPIIGMISTTENVFAGLPRIAKLRKGAPKEERTRKDGTKYEVVGRDLDHLRVAFDPEYDHLKATFKKLYGEKPTEFAAFLNADTVHEAFDFWKEEWTATTMLRRCDGKHKHVWFDQDSKRYSSAKVMCDVKCGCKAVGRLNIILPAFTMETGVMGYFTVETHSEEDIRTLYARITSIWATFGRLRGIPLIFYRVPRKMSVPEIGADKQPTGKRMNKTMHMLDVRVDPEYAKEHLMAAIMAQRAELPAPPVSSLPALPDARRSIMMLSNGSERRVDTGLNQNGNGNHTAVIEAPVVVEDKPAPAPEIEGQIVPAWFTPEACLALVRRAKDEGLTKETAWEKFLPKTGLTDVDCFKFESGDALFVHIKAAAVAKKKAAKQAPPPPEPEIFTRVVIAREASYHKMGSTVKFITPDGELKLERDTVLKLLTAGNEEENRAGNAWVKKTNLMLWNGSLPLGSMHDLAECPLSITYRTTDPLEVLSIVPVAVEVIAPATPALSPEEAQLRAAVDAAPAPPF